MEMNCNGTNWHNTLPYLTSILTVNGYEAHALSDDTTVSIKLFSVHPHIVVTWCAGDVNLGRESTELS